MECCEKGMAELQEKALDLIRQIQELLPKDNSGQQGQNQQQNQQNQNQQNQQQGQGQDDQQDKQQDQGEERQQDQGEQQEEKDSDDKQGDESDPGDEELEAVLKKAQERNDEHEAEKKARMRKAPLPPNERDW